MSMFIFKPRDLLLKSKIVLFNNLARSGKCTGRLLTELEVFPSPRITWNFETLGKTACTPKETNNVLDEPFLGSGLRIDQPRITRWGSITNPIRVQLSGVSTNVLYGSPHFKGHVFYFYIPNARFQEENLVGQGKIDFIGKATLADESWELGEKTEGRFITVPIDNYWQIHLETRQDALDWLKPNNRNYGTYITTIGELSRRESKGQVVPNRYRLLTLNDAISRLWSFCLFLSFANGGYIGPLYVEGYHKHKRQSSGRFLSSLNSPLEQIGNSWLTIHSDLSGYIQCFAAFERMGSLSHWQEDFDLVLTRYFQAIQPENLQINKSWPVVANSIGAALERLSVLILEKDLHGKVPYKLKGKIVSLLEKLGITSSRGFHDIKDVHKFVEIRNDATHSKSMSSISIQERNEILGLAIQWVEEALLWRLGYTGQYRDHLKPHYASTKPRYDLTTRDPSW